MNRLLVIGIGVGAPEHLTLEAVAALGTVDVFFVVDKGSPTADLVAMRAEILQRHRPDSRFRIVPIAEVARDRAPTDYQATIRTWHEARADAYAKAITGALADDECGAFLVWGDPAVYDSTIRILEELIATGRISVQLEIIPGLSSLQVLAARHRISLNRIGEPVLITTGRRLVADGLPERGDVVVMLDGECAFTTVTEPVDIYWGAYLGTPHELLLSGPLAEVAHEIERTRAKARATHHWIMDVYLLRRRSA